MNLPYDMKEKKTNAIFGSISIHLLDTSCFLFKPGKIDHFLYTFSTEIEEKI